MPRAALVGPIHLEDERFFPGGDHCFGCNGTLPRTLAILGLPAVFASQRTKALLKALYLVFSSGAVSRLQRIHLH